MLQGDGDGGGGDDSGLQIPDPLLDSSEVGLSSDETSSWFADKYEATSKAKIDVARRVHKLASYLIPLGILFMFLAASALGLVFLLHLILPEGYRWLSPPQVQQVHDLLFSAIAGAAISGMTKAYFRSDKPEE